jgi:hypothetical protein
LDRCRRCARRPSGRRHWRLRLYLNWLPPFFKNSYKFDIKKSALFASGVFFAGAVGDALGSVLSYGIFQRTGNLRLARLSITVLGFARGFLPLMPIFWTHDITAIAICLSAGFFFAELVIGPMWRSRWTSRRNIPARRQG